MHFRSQRNDSDHGWNWFGDAALLPESYNGNDKRATFANAANFGTGGENGSEILVGWAERWRGQGSMTGETDHYVVSRATREGILIGQPWSINGGPGPGSLTNEPTGWGEDNNCKNPVHGGDNNLSVSPSMLPTASNPIAAPMTSPPKPVRLPARVLAPMSFLGLISFPVTMFALHR